MIEGTPLGVKYDVQGTVARITLNRPQVLNALSTEMFRDLTRRMKRAIQDRKVNFIVVSGTGRAFSAGLDITQVGSFKTNLEARRFVYRVVKPFWDVFLLDCHKPIVAVVNGPAYGAGAEIALFSDVVLASHRASFAFSGGRVGALCCISAALGHLVLGGRKIVEMNFLGNPFSGEEALKLGLINDLVTEQDLERKTTEWIQDLMRTSPDSNASFKRIRNGLISRSSLEIAYDQLYRTLVTKNFKKGSEAFRKKSSPNYYD